MARERLRVRVLRTWDTGMHLEDETGKKYTWQTRSYSSPLFYDTGEWYDISADTFLYDPSLDWVGVRNVRVLKGRKS